MYMPIALIHECVHQGALSSKLYLPSLGVFPEVVHIILFQIIISISYLPAISNWNFMVKRL
jgi:hypothetical protein